MTFNVRSDAPLGTSFIGLKFTSSPDGTPGNANLEILSATTVPGGVNVTAGGGGDDGSGDGGTGGSGEVLSPPESSFIGGGVWTMDSGADLVKIVEKGFSLFDSVRVNGNTLARNGHYEARSGSTVISLFAGYLETLEVGQHTIQVRFTDGVNVSSQFTIAEAVTRTQPEQPTTEQPPEDDAGFIGVPYTQDDTGSETSIARPAASGTSSRDQGFGRVPQTGVPDVARLVAYMGLSILMSTCLWVHVFRRLRAKGKEKALACPSASKKR
jgi:hypothetical protein